MDRDLRVVLSARVFSDQKCFGPGVSQLLKRVDELDWQLRGLPGVDTTNSLALLNRRPRTSA